MRFIIETDGDDIRVVPVHDDYEATLSGPPPAILAKAAELGATDAGRAPTWQHIRVPNAVTDAIAATDAGPSQATAAKPPPARTTPPRKTTAKKTTAKKAPARKTATKRRR